MTKSDLVRNLLIIFFLVVTNLSYSQITGEIKDQDGEPLPYVTIYEKGTSEGTISNEDGHFQLDISQESANLVFTYIGYKPEEINVKKSDHINVTMKPTSYDLEEIVIAADAEDPAYAIIREAISKRSYYRNNIEEYTANLYIKGNVKMLSAPTSFLGNDIGDLGGLIDTTTGQGILYLGESESHLFYRAPNQIKEVMYSSKVAESDGSFNPNTISGAYYNIYDEDFQFSRTLLNPLADNALTFYKYKLEGSSLNKDGKIVNKIEVIPKSDVRPLLHGYIYIYSDEWSVPEVDLSFTGKSVKSNLFDTVNIKQVYIPIKDDKYSLFSQNLNFKGGLFGFKIGGVFNFIFSDYDIETPIDDSVFNAETFRMEVDAVKNDSSFWEKVRPIPLTQNEKVEYVRKDSLKKVWSSKSYLDSLDRVGNKFKVIDILSGYSYSNRYRNNYFDISSILSSYHYNAVEGHSLGINIDYTTYDSTDVKRFKIGSKVRYGFNDERFKGDLSFSYRPNLKDLEYWNFAIGDEYVQYCDCGDTPVPALYNSIGALIFDDNQIKLFNKRYVDFDYQREIINGVVIKPNISYQQRSSLVNFNDKYESNHPLNSDLTGDFFDTHEKFSVGLKVTIKPFQEYATYINSKGRTRSNWPDVFIDYQKSFKFLGGDTKFDKLKIIINDNYVNAKIYGRSSYRLEAGSFLNSEQGFFMDQFHFISNEYLITSPKNYRFGFKRMPHYRFSTTQDYLLGYFNHNFDGYITDLIPLVNLLGWKVVASASSLVVKDSENYHELSVGIDNIGVKSFRFLRVDYVWSFNDLGMQDRGWALGLVLDIR